MRKFTLLGALAFFCVTVAQADISDWGNDKIVKPSELQTGGEFVLRCPATDLGGLTYLSGTACVSTESEDIVWVFEEASTEGKFYLRKKNAENDETAYVQKPANQNNGTKVTLGSKASAGEFEFRAITEESDMNKFASSKKLDDTYSAEHSGRLVVMADNGTESALRNGKDAGGTYAGTAGAEWTVWNVYQVDDDFYNYLSYLQINGPVIEQYLLPAAEGAVGGFHAEDLTGVRSAAEAGDWVAANTALQQLISGGKQIAFDAGKYYTIVSAQAAAAGADKYLFESYTTVNASGDYSVRWGDFAGVSSLWKFIPAGTATVGEGSVPQYNLQALNSGFCLPKVAFNSATFFSETTTPGLYELEDGLSSANASSIAASFAIKSYNEGRGDFVMLTAQKNGSPGASSAPDWSTDSEGCISTYKGLAVNWYLCPVETYAVTVPEGSQYATFNLPFAVELADGLTAYVGGEASVDEISLLPLDGNVVPAGCPVILVADNAGSYDLTIAYGDETEAPADNTLSGTLVPETLAADDAAYVVASGAAGVGFYKVTSETDRTIPANKAYYAPKGNVSAAAVLSFSFGNGTTGISGVTVEGDDAADGAYYDLQGRRVLYPSHGVYVKESGEKVYIR